MKNIICCALLAAMALSTTACSFIARGPDDYRKATREALDKNNDMLKTCYDGVLREDKAAAGDVTVKFTVQAESGVIQNAEVVKGKTTAPEALQKCVLDAVSSAKIAPPDAREGHATFTFQLTIKPQTSAHASKESGFSAGS